MLIRLKRRSRDNPETAWGRDAGKDAGSWVVWMMGGFLLILTGGGLTAWFLRSMEDRPIAKAAPMADGDAMREGLEASEAVARAFLQETDPAKRLQWVRNAEEVKQRIGEYPDEARSAEGNIEKTLGHQVDGGRSVTGFVVEFPTGNLRLLEVVGTPDGPRVDWDAYARHCSASWDDLWSGEVKRAVVRVFCEPSTERPEPFEDQGKWTCFRMSGPELPRAALGFAAVGSVREAKMKQVVLGTPKYRQRFALEIVRHEGEDEPLFEITRCLAVGWILDELAVDQAWETEK